LDIHPFDGTYELFRHFHALPCAIDADGHEVAAVRGVVASVLGMVNRGATHVGVATDHVIESFRNWSAFGPRWVSRHAPASFRSTPGPMARTVADAVAVFDVIAASDAADR